VIGRAALLALLALAGCDQNMVQQSRYDAFEASNLFPNGQAMQPPPEGTVDLTATARDAASATSPPVTRALLLRGRERFGIFCAPCHGLDGRGNGVVPSRGFPHPPNLLVPAIREIADRKIFDVITSGYGIMYAYGDRVPPKDRWAIVNWIRVLQAAQPVEQAVGAPQQAEPVSEDRRAFEGAAAAQGPVGG
jgi:mono/diheme cytochrome c family protein